MRVPCLLLALLTIALPPVAAAAPSGENIEARIETMLSRMTVDEKIGQLNIAEVEDALASDVITRGGAGSVIGFSDAAAIGRIQELARTSRLGIPLLFGLDVLHGFRTLFPVPLGEAASFDPALARRTAELAAREARASGLNWTFAPMVDVSRDPRWGRGVEGSGEDALLARRFAEARVQGFRAGGMAVTLKHFAAYGAVEGGRDYDAASVPATELYNLHFPPYQAGLAAGADGVMTALTVLNGVPSSADPWLLRDVLRGQWKFDGMVVSDWASIEGLLGQGLAADGAEAARKALLAGVDVDMMSGLYAKHLPAEIAAGRVPMTALDEAVRHVLRTKFRFGLFEHPPVDPAKAAAATLTPELRAAAREAARRSFVLLQNENDVLPIKRGATKIAVIGPYADNAFDQLGPHEARGRAEEAVTILRGLRDRAKSAGAEIEFAQGCDRLCGGDDGFVEAVETAEAADVVIAVLGEKREFSGEGASRANLKLWGRQEELLDALAATGKPVVLVLVAGRTLDLSRAVLKIPSILMAWYPGTEGGNAVADVLFGDAAPSGKLPVSWPRSVGQAPIHYDRLASGRPSEGGGRYVLRFIDEDHTPLFPFGYGLTYSRFAYSRLRVVTPVVAPGGVAELTVEVTNTGMRDGTETVQLYVRDEVASQTRPVRQLKAFERVFVKDGETRGVTLRVPVSDLGFHRADGSYVVEPGQFRLWVGGSSTADLEGAFEVR